MNKEQEDRLKRIEVGIYGDKEAGISGVIGTQKDQEKRLHKLEKTKWKERGIIGALVMAWTYIKEF